MKSIKKLFKWGLCLTIIPPILGTAGTVIGMVQSFNSMGTKQGSEKAEALAHSISFNLWTTAIGLSFSLIGVVLLIVCLFRYLAYKKEQKEITA